MSNYSNSGSVPVTFSNCLPVIFSKFAVGKGRASRSEYWFFQLWQVIIVIGGFIFISLFGNTSTAEVLMIIFLLTLFALVIPNVTCTVRRLHDTGRSAHYLWFSLIPFIGGIIMFVFSVEPSQIGANQYGDQP